MASERDLKLEARHTALELMVQHLIWAAHGKNLNALKDYAKLIDQSLSTATLRGHDPAMSDLMADEIRLQAADILGTLIARLEKHQARGS